MAAPALLLVSVLAACSHGPRVYRESWQPEEQGAALAPRVLVAALLLNGNADIEIMNRAGATLIGWHDAKNSWALRAASTGGTHFAPVQVPAPVVQSACSSWGDTILCSAGPKARHWSRVAVFRLTADRWHALPPHLIPTDGDVMGVAASAVRSGCRPVDSDYGIVRCNRGWQVVSNAAAAAVVPPIVLEPVGPAVPQPRGPTTMTEPAEPYIDLEGTAPNP